jgi:putative N6-adenine-specific DNA methylase
VSAARHRLIVVCAPGLETLCAAEVAALGVRGIEVEPGGITFAATTRQLYTANMQLRMASRVLVRLASFPAESFAVLDKTASEVVPWTDILPPGARVRFRVRSHLSKLYHEEGIAQRLTRASGALAGDGPEAQLFVVRVIRDVVTVSADSSGELLHRRGYRLATAKAPLRETIAAALLAAGGWMPAAPLLDPFCGSGTIAIEAALRSREIAPGLNRRFAFEQWPIFEGGTLASVRGAAKARVRVAAEAAITGFDRDMGAIRAARENAERAGVAADIRFEAQPLVSLQPPTGAAGAVVTNPPYGVRVGEAAGMRGLYTQLGDAMRGPLAGWSLTMLSADPMFEVATGLSWREVARTSHGGIPVGLCTTAGSTP